MHYVLQIIRWEKATSKREILYDIIIQRNMYTEKANIIVIENKDVDQQVKIEENEEQEKINAKSKRLVVDEEEAPKKQSFTTENINNVENEFFETEIESSSDAKLIEMEAEDELMKLSEFENNDNNEVEIKLEINELKLEQELAEYENETLNENSVATKEISVQQPHEIEKDEKFLDLDEEVERLLSEEKEKEKEEKKHIHEESVKREEHENVKDHESTKEVLHKKQDEINLEESGVSVDPQLVEEHESTKQHKNSKNEPVIDIDVHDPNNNIKKENSVALSNNKYPEIKNHSEHEIKK